MATPVRERRGSRRDEESPSREPFVPSNNLVRDKTDSARADAATDKNGGAPQLEKISSSLESKFPELSFTLGRALDNDKQVLVVSHHVLAFMPRLCRHLATPLVFELPSKKTVVTESTCYCERWKTEL